MSFRLNSLTVRWKMSLRHWTGTGININGMYLNHLRYADDIVILSESPSELQTMMEQLYHASLKVGLKMNMDKTKVKLYQLP